MTLRTRALAVLVLAGVVAISSALARGDPSGSTVTSSLDGKTALPLRIQWSAMPKTARPVAEVDYFIDGFHAWTQHSPPWYLKGRARGERQEHAARPARRRPLPQSRPRHAGHVETRPLTQGAHK